MSKNHFEQDESLEFSEKRPPKLGEIPTDNRSGIQLAFQKPISKETRDSEAQVKERERFAKTYGSAIEAYFLVKTRCPQQTQELCDRFTDKFLGGDLEDYDPSLPLRPYLFRILKNTCFQYWKDVTKERSWVVPMDEQQLKMIPGREPTLDEAELAFDRELKVKIQLDALESMRNEARLHIHYYPAMRFMLSCRGFDLDDIAADDGDFSEFDSDGNAGATKGRKKVSAADLAEYLSQIQEKQQLIKTETITESAARQILCRARDKYREALIDQVKGISGGSSRSEVEEELARLKLLVFCKPALDKKQ